MNDETMKALMAMGCISVLEAVALLQGINGTVYSLVIAALAGLGGYALAKRKETGY